MNNQDQTAGASEEQDLSKMDKSNVPILDNQRDANQFIQVPAPEVEEDYNFGKGKGKKQSQNREDLEKEIVFDSIHSVERTA